MQKLLRSNFVLILTVSLLGLWFSSVVLAQEAQKQQADLSAEELKAFAKAYVEVDKIRLAYEPSLRNAQDPQHLQNIQQEVAVRMEEAVQEQGLTRESYVKIFNTVKDDPQLRGKTLKLIEEEKQKR